MNGIPESSGTAGSPIPKIWCPRCKTYTSFYSNGCNNNCGIIFKDSGDPCKVGENFFVFLCDKSDVTKDNLL